MKYKFTEQYSFKDDMTPSETKSAVSRYSWKYFNAIGEEEIKGSVLKLMWSDWADSKSPSGPKKDPILIDNDKYDLTIYTIAYLEGFKKALERILTGKLDLQDIINDIKPEEQEQ